MVAKKTGAILKYLYVDKDGQIPFEEIENKVNKNTKIFSCTLASNVLGTVPDAKKIIKYVRKNSDAVIISDGAQYVPHHKIDVCDLDCDFLAFSGHKMYSATGTSADKIDEAEDRERFEELLNSLSPFLSGGDMIEYVYEDKSTFLKSPQRFEAGTQNVEGAVSLAAAINYVESIGLEKIDEYENINEYHIIVVIKHEYNVLP